MDSTAVYYRMDSPVMGGAMVEVIGW